MNRTITFIVTNRCNARCRYCYFVDKPDDDMTRDVARAAVDRLLADERLAQGREGLSLDFIGGEPLLRADLIDEIVRYTRLRTYELGHPWFNSITSSISTNGLLYLTPEAQGLTRYRGLEIQITIDGPEDVHDSQRGAGTYAQIMQAFPAWREQYPASGTKVTLVPATLPHLARSVLHLLGELRLPQVHANPVFEDIWSPRDAEVYEEQLEQLAGAMQAQGIPLERCSLYGAHVGRPTRSASNWCGCGSAMIAVDVDGSFYPCVRFAPTSLSRPPLRAGNLDEGIDWPVLEQFERLTCASKSPAKCQACEVSGGCAWCTGFDYDESGTITHRATHICELHKARARVNRRLQDAGAIPQGDPRGARGDQAAPRAKDRAEGARVQHEPNGPAGVPRHV